jgi:hypothetical protein
VVKEMIDFDLAIGEAMRFDDSNGETLVIVTGAMKQVALVFYRATSAKVISREILVHPTIPQCWFLFLHMAHIPRISEECIKTPLSLKRFYGYFKYTISKIHKSRPGCFSKYLDSVLSAYSIR